MPAIFPPIERDPVASALVATETTNRTNADNTLAAAQAASAQKSANLSDLASIPTAKTNLALVKADVGLALVDNVPDASKPVSTAQAAADALRVLKTANGSDFSDPEAAKFNLGVPAMTARAVATANRALTGLPLLDSYQTSLTGTGGAPDTVLLTAQTTASQNGLWLVAAGAWSRPTNFPHSGVLLRSRTVTVGGGKKYAGTAWVLPVTSSVTIDSDSQAWQIRPVIASQLPASAVQTDSGGHIATGVLPVPKINAAPTPNLTSNSLGSHIAKITGLASSTTLLPTNAWAPGDSGWSAEAQGTCTANGGFVGAQLNLSGETLAKPGAVWGASVTPNVLSAVSAGGGGLYVKLLFLDAANATLASTVSATVNALGVPSAPLQVIGVAPAGTVSVIAWIVQQGLSGDTIHFYAGNFQLQKLSDGLAPIVAALASPTTNELYMSMAGKSDGAAPVAADTGQAWTYSTAGPSAPFSTLSGAWYAANGNVSGAACYAEALVSGNVTRVGMRFKWGPGSLDGNAGSAATLGCWDDPGIAAAGGNKPNCPAHAVTTTGTEGIAVWDGYTGIVSATIRTIFSKFFGPGLQNDGTVYTIDILMQGDTMIVSLPDGTLIALKDPSIAADAVARVFYEINGTFSGTSSRPSITEVWADPTPVNLGLTLDPFFPSQAQLSARSVVWSGTPNGSPSIVALNGVPVTGTDARLALDQAPNIITIGTSTARASAPHVKNALWKESDTGFVYYDDGVAWQSFASAAVAPVESATSSWQTSSGASIPLTTTQADLNVAGLVLNGAAPPLQATATMTIASPAVASTIAAHGLVAGDSVAFSTTGALPTGVTANVTYVVLATGLTATNFQFAATFGGAAINTTGSQSGVHTANQPVYVLVTPPLTGSGNVKIDGTIYCGGTNVTASAVDIIAQLRYGAASKLTQKLMSIGPQIATTPVVSPSLFVALPFGGVLTGLTLGNGYTPGTAYKFYVQMQASAASVALARFATGNGSFISLSATPLP